MPISINGAWRAFSLLIQADIATAQPVDTTLYFEGEPMEPELDIRLNDTEINGEVMPTTHRILMRKFAGKHKQKAYPHLVGLFASMVMGKDTPTVVGTTTAHQHKLEINKSIQDLPLRTMVEFDGLKQFRYPGVGATGFTLTGKRGDFVEFEVDLVGAGGEADDATPKPGRVDESYMTYGDCKLYQGGAFDGDAVTGAMEISAGVLDFTASLKNNGKAAYLMGDSSGKAGRVQRGMKYAAELKAKLEVEDQSHRAALLAGTEMVMWIPIVGGVANGTANYKIELIYPRVIYRAAKKGVDDGSLVLAGDFAVLSDPTYGALIINVINMQAASYLAAA